MINKNVAVYVAKEVFAIGAGVTAAVMAMPTIKKFFKLVKPVEEPIPVPSEDIEEEEVTEE